MFEALTEKQTFNAIFGAAFAVVGVVTLAYLWMQIRKDRRP